MDRMHGHNFHHSVYYNSVWVDWPQLPSVFLLQTNWADACTHTAVFTLPARSTILAIGTHARGVVGNVNAQLRPIPEIRQQ